MYSSAPDEVVAIGDALLSFIDRDVASIEKEGRDVLSSDRTIYDDTGRYSQAVLDMRKRVRMKSAELGFYNMFAPASIGGDELGPVAAVEIQERLNEHVGPGRTLIQTVALPSPFTNGLSPVLTSMDPAVFAQYRDGIASGERTLCFALSEPDAGSDVFSMKTKAVRDGDHWVLNGTKQWITNAPYADYAMVFAVTDEQLARERKGGITGFFVPTGTPGFSVPGLIQVTGSIGSETGIVSLEDVRVPDDHRLGPVGGGLKVAIGGVSVGRLGMAGACVGLARWALKKSVDYANVRKAGGKVIGQHQAVQILLAKSATDIYAAKMMTRDCAARIETGLDSVKQTSMVKMFATEMVSRVMDNCIQIHGGMGLTNEMKLEAGYRWARVNRITDGTAEIHMRNIARRLLAGELD